jgi:hypothetical protein
MVLYDSLNNEGQSRLGLCRLAFHTPIFFSQRPARGVLLHCSKNLPTFGKPWPLS